MCNLLFYCLLLHLYVVFVLTVSLLIYMQIIYIHYKEVIRYSCILFKYEFPKK